MRTSEQKEENKNERKSNFFTSKRAGLINWFATGVLTLFGIVVSIFGNKLNPWICVVIMLALAIYPVVYAINTFSQRANLIDMTNKAVDLKVSLQKVLENLVKLDDITIGNIDKAIPQIENGKLEFQAGWGYEERCKGICDKIFDSVQAYSTCDDIEILITMKTDEEINILCYSKEEEAEPKGFNSFRPITSEIGSYYDQKYFDKYRKGNPEVEVSSDKKITDHDLYKSNGKYEQYIFVPISLPEGHHRLIGLVEVVSKVGKRIAKDDDSLKEVAKNTIVPYARQIALLYNIEKVMKAKPDSKGVACNEKNEI